MTVVLSEKGWVRAAKGHDIEPGGLSFKSGDKFAMSARGRTKFGADAGDMRAGVVEQLGRERSCANTGRVCLDDTENVIEVARPHAGAGTGCGCHGV